MLWDNDIRTGWFSVDFVANPSTVHCYCQVPVVDSLVPFFHGELDVFVHCVHILIQSSLKASRTLPNPEQWDWMTNQEDEWSPKWTVLPIAAKRFKELIKCSCKKCGTRCYLCKE